MSLGKKTIPPSDSSISWSSHQSNAVPLISMKTSSSRVCLWYGGSSPSLTSKRPIINLPSVALPSSKIASVPPSSHSSCCCCSGCARYAMLTRHPISSSAGTPASRESVSYRSALLNGVLAASVRTGGVHQRKVLQQCGEVTFGGEVDGATAAERREQRELSQAVAEVRHQTLG